MATRKEVIIKDFEKIIEYLKHGDLTDEQIKELVTEALNDGYIYGDDIVPEKVEVHTVPPVIYGPPRMEEPVEVHVESVSIPPVLYGPPPASEPVEVHVVENPPVLYGPPRRR